MNNNLRKGVKNMYLIFISKYSLVMATGFIYISCLILGSVMFQHIEREAKDLRCKRKVIFNFRMKKSLNFVILKNISINL